MPLQPGSQARAPGSRWAQPTAMQVSPRPHPRFTALPDWYVEKQELGQPGEPHAGWGRWAEGLVSMRDRGLTWKGDRTRPLCPVPQGQAAV